MGHITANTGNCFKKKSDLRMNLKEEDRINKPKADVTWETIMEFGSMQLSFSGGPADANHEVGLQHHLEFTVKI